MQVKKRDRVEVCPNGNFWKVTRNGDPLADECKTQQDAIDLAVRVCKHRWKELKQPAELFIKGRNGKVRDSRTYGRDPRNVKG